MLNFFLPKLEILELFKQNLFKVKILKCVLFIYVQKKND